MNPLATFAASLVLSLLFIPLVRRVSFRFGKVAQPRDDRWHSKATPTLGGIAIFAAALIGLLVSVWVANGWAQVQWGLLAGPALIFLLGLYDDFKRLSPQAKLGGQILAATVVVALGYTTDFFSPRIENQFLAGLPNILLTYLWLVGISNAINLLDNMDGLAGGIALITAGILSYFFWSSGEVGLLAFSLALAGAALGFLFFNFPPASIFMGDSGSLFLGFSLALLAIARQAQASNVFAVLGVPSLLFLLPILDTALVTFTRLLRGQSPAQGGRDHTSHRLIAFGLSERQAVLSLYAVALLSGVMAAALESIRYVFSLVLVPLLIVSLALLTAYLGRLKVVAGSSRGDRGGAFTRIMLELTLRRRLLEVALDFFLIGIAYYLAFLTHFGAAMSDASLEIYLSSLPLALAGAYLAFFGMGIYRGHWRYVDLRDLTRHLRAALGAGLLLAGAVYGLGRLGILLWAPAFSPAIPLLFGVYLFLGLAAARSSFRVLDLFSVQRAHQSQQRVLIYNAGDEGEMALRWILMKPELDYQPVGFLDGDPYLNGRQIHGVPVLGDLGILPEKLDNDGIDGLILAGVDPGSEEARLAVSICRRYNCWVRYLCLEFTEVG